MINDILERLFLGSDINTSRSDAKGRLKLVLAHDRSNLTPDLMAAMRRDILEVVSRYVELDPEGLDVSLESDQRTTALIANLPIRRIKAAPQPPAQPPAQTLPQHQAQPQSTTQSQPPTQPQAQPQSPNQSQPQSRPQL